MWNHVLHLVDIPPRKWTFLEVVRASEKHGESLLRCTQQNGSFNPQSGTTCDAAFRQNSLTTCLYLPRFYVLGSALSIAISASVCVSICLFVWSSVRSHISKPPLQLSPNGGNAAQSAVFDCILFNFRLHRMVQYIDTAYCYRWCM